MFRRPLKPQPREPQRCFSHCAIKYTVQSGDNISKILSKFKVNIYDLKKYNYHIRNLNYLIPGDTLCIPKPKPYCAFLTPTNNAPKNSYVIIAGSNGIYVLANLPAIDELEGNFDSYYVYAENLYTNNHAKLLCIAKKPTIWSGQISKIELNPTTKIYISVNKDKEKLDSPENLVLFEST